MIQYISRYQPGSNQWVSHMWIRLLIAISTHFPLCPKCGGHTFLGIFILTYYLGLGAYILENLDLSMTSVNTDLRRYVFESTLIWMWHHRTHIWGNSALEGHGSEYDVMIGHGSEAVYGSESYIYIFVHTIF
jgi:hypothetical protein